MSSDAAFRPGLRLASIALFAGGPVLLAALTVLNLLRAADLDALDGRQKELLGQFERRLGQGRVADATSDMSAIYLAAGTGTLAKAEIQQLVTTMIDQASGRLIEAQAGDEAEPEATGRVQLRATFDTTNARLFDLLYAVETRLPLLVVEQISIRKLPSRTEGDGEDPLLRVSLAVRGHWRGEGG